MTATQSTPSASQKRRQRMALAGLALLLVLVTAMAALRVGERLEPVPVLPRAPLAVDVEQLRPEPFVVSHKYTGSVEAHQRVIISARVTAVVKEIPFREGQTVGKGQLIALLDDQEMTEELRRLKASEQRTRSELDFWETQLKRDEKLFKAGTIPERNRDESLRTVATLKASLRENGEEQAMARTRRDYTVLTAPFDGRIQAIHVLPGELAMPGKSLVELVASRPLKAVVSVPQSDLPELGTELPVQVRIPAANATLTGRVDQLYPALEPGTRTATLEIFLRSDTEGLLPGMQADVEVILHSEEAALVLPFEAIRERNGETGVYVVRDHTAAWSPITPGARMGRRIQVLGGLEGGEWVVTTPDPRLNDGQPLWLAGKESL
ncbi:MAG: efflux RND transporter periplasmic adaptor subunit [Gammaproteobacteria bacterium]|nr:efflux RND transporter periplasmic adaptor subunit [Gammaproteobacteria bacterium]